MLSGFTYKAKINYLQVESICQLYTLQKYKLSYFCSKRQRVQPVSHRKAIEAHALYRHRALLPVPIEICLKI